MQTFTVGFLAYLLFIVGLMGLIMGSFLNCLSYRLCNGQSVLKGRSKCPSCSHTLSPKELIPVFSYILQGGKCLNCKVKISARYPISEIITMVIFLSIAVKFGISLETLKYIIFACILLVAVFSDFETMTIPDSVHVLAALNWAVFLLFESDPWSAFKFGFIGGASFLAGMIVIVTIADKVLQRDSMGGADIKLYAVCGLYFGVMGNFLLLMLSCFLGIFMAVISQTKKGVEFPFGPSIAVAAWVVLLFGDGIIKWYLAFL